MKLYAIQIKGPDGWEFGPPFYGLDMSTGLVGGAFTGSRERAVETMKERSAAMLPGRVRVLGFSKTETISLSEPTDPKEEKSCVDGSCSSSGYPAEDWCTPCLRKIALLVRDRG